VIHCCSDIAQIVSMGTCFVCKAHYLVMALVCLVISWSLSSNGSTRQNMVGLQEKLFVFSTHKELNETILMFITVMQRGTECHMRHERMHL
jgi:hypothetical protein